jgi:hypothetical protein
MQKLIKGFSQFVNESNHTNSFRTTTEFNLMTAIKMEVDKLLPNWNTSLQKSGYDSYVIYVESPEDPENYYFIEPSLDNYYRGQEEEDEFSPTEDIVEIFISKGDGSTDPHSMTVAPSTDDLSMKKLASQVALDLKTWIGDENYNDYRSLIMGH